MTIAELVELSIKYGVRPTGSIDPQKWQAAVENNTHEYLRDIGRLIKALTDKEI